MICTACKEVVPGGYAYCLNCGLYLGEPTVVLPPDGPTPSATPTPAASGAPEAPTTAPASNRLPWVIAGASFTALFIVLILGGAHFFFRDDQQLQPSASLSPDSAISQPSIAPESGPTPALAPTKEARAQPTVAALPSPAVRSVANESTTAPLVGTNDPNKIYSGNDVSSKAQILSKPKPDYTEEARKNQIVGTVVLRAVFTSSGEVTNIRAVSGLPFGLTERAIAAARNIKFSPAIKDGRPVAMYIQLEYNFNLY